MSTHHNNNSDGKSGKVTSADANLRTPAEEKILARAEKELSKHGLSKAGKLFLDALKTKADDLAEITRQDMKDLAEEAINAQYAGQQYRLTPQLRNAYDTWIATNSKEDRDVYKKLAQEEKTMMDSAWKDKRAFDRVIKHAKALDAGEEFGADEKEYLKELKRYFEKQTMPGYPKLNSQEKEALKQVEDELRKPGKPDTNTLRSILGSINADWIEDVPMPSFNPPHTPSVPNTTSKSEGRT